MSDNFTIYFEKNKNGSRNIETMRGIKKIHEHRYVYAPPGLGKEINIAIQDEHIAVSFLETFDQKTASDLLVEIEKFYDLLKTHAYGVVDQEGDGSEYEDTDKTKISEISKIWSLTILTKEEVSRIGESVVRNAPCSIVKKLPDGAYLLMLEDFFQSTYEERKELRKHLGEHEHK